MKRSGKIALAVGVGCILLGCIGVFGVFAHLGFDAGRLEGPWLDFPETQAGSQDSAGAVETVTYTVTDPFDRIQVREECGHVRFVLTDGGPCRVECVRWAGVKHTVGIEDGALSITAEDTRRWYQRIGVWISQVSTTVYLPCEEYDFLTVSTASGDVDLPAGLTLGEADISTASGDILWKAQVLGSLSVQSTSGKIQLEDTQAESLSAHSVSGDISLCRLEADGPLRIETASGKILLEDTRGDTLSVTTASGNVFLSRTQVQGLASLRTASGAIRLEEADAESLEIRSVSGDVEGTLLSGKRFYVSTVTGDVDVPSSQGGPCRVETTSGSVRLAVEN